MSKKKVERVIGFDLGHGETALAYVRLGSHAWPKMLEVNKKKTQITAVARHPKRGTLIGEDAFMLGATEFRIGFKRKPSEATPDQRQAIQRFAKALYQWLVDEGQIRQEGRSHFIVGCPSGWSKEERQAYKKLLAASGIPSLEVEPESRAAFWEAKGSDLPLEELEKSVLVIDIGSSTTDFTLVEGQFHKPFDSGLDLGAALIDKTILARTLAGHEDGEELGKVFEEHPHVRNRCELYCRKAKEEYFIHYEFHQEKPGEEVNIGYEKIRLKGKRLIFEPLVTGPIMQEILEEPLDELDGKGWRQAFRDEVSALKERADREGFTVDVIVLTGGASRMNFVRPICEQVFPGCRCWRDSEPEFTIARGLARLGQNNLLKLDFMKDVRGFIANELPSIIESHVHQLIESLVETLTDGLMTEVIEPTLHGWREGAIKTLDDLESGMEGKVTRWMKSRKTRNRTAREVARWISPITKKVEEETRKICEGHNAKSESLTLKIGKLSTDAAGFQRIAVDDPTILDEIISNVAIAILTTILFALEFTVASFGPIGWTFGLITGILAAYYGKEKTVSYFKKQNIPVPVRKLLLREKKIRQVTQEKKPELKKSFQDMLNQDPEIKAKIVRDVSRQLEVALEERVDGVGLIIA